MTRVADTAKLYLDDVSSACETHRMTVEITLGRHPDESEFAPLSAAQRAKWRELSGEIAAIRASGRVVEVYDLD